MEEILGKKRIIFDIDYTLLIPNYYREEEFFRSELPGCGDFLLDNRYAILKSYENEYNRYTIDQLLNHLNRFSEVPIGREFIDKWFEFNLDLDPQDITEVKETLDYLKEKYELVALSNWFKIPQIGKLERVGIKEYFQEVYTGEDFLKPNAEAFRLAIFPYDVSSCLMIGDNLENDVIAASKIGLDAIHFTRGYDETHTYRKIKQIGELRKIL